jgi:hypothetical protein
MEAKSYTWMRRPETSSVTSNAGRKAIVRLSLSNDGTLRCGAYGAEIPVTVVGEKPWPFEVHAETAALGPALLLSDGHLISRAALGILRLQADAQWPCMI